MSNERVVQGPDVSAFSLPVPVLVGFALITLFASSAISQGPDTLWHIVHDACVPQEEEFGTPAPCLSVTRDYVVLKDRVGRSQFLLIPTARISGIEDPSILALNGPNYLELAWEITPLVQHAVRLELPRDALSLAVNSVSARSQNQLHIHVDCVRTDVRDALRTLPIGEAWKSITLVGYQFRAIRVDSLKQVGKTPFQLLSELPDARGNMAAESLVVVGATFEDGTSGFYLLETSVVAGEALQDHSCAIAADIGR